jgi:hypothetical protein
LILKPQFAQEELTELKQEIPKYSFKSPLPDSEGVPGLDRVLRRMLDTDRATRYSNAVEALEAMQWIATEPNENFCRTMLEQQVVPAMRALFLRHWEEKEGIPWEDTPDCGQLYLAREIRCNKKAGNWLIRERLAAGDSKTWDATALCTILLWSQVHPLKRNEAPEDFEDVSSFREWRNELAHSETWSAGKALHCSNVMRNFIERHLWNRA